jgi:hypothetical protein
MVLPPTFNLPALAQLPLHKQMLLSPLLASSHVMQAAAMAAMAAATRNAATAVTTASPHSMLLQQHQEQLQHLSLLAEHRALLERFRSSLSGAVRGEEEDKKVAEVLRGGHPIDLSAKRSSSSSPPRHDECKPGSSPTASSSSSFQTFPNLSDSDEEPDEKEKQE